MIKIAVCDDEITLCDNIVTYLNKIQDNILEDFSIDVFTDGNDFSKALMNNIQYDIIFLDINLTDTTGVEIGMLLRKNLNNYYSNIVFISSDESYAMQLFDLHPLNFLIKPISFSKMQEVIYTALKILNKHEQFFVFETSKEIFQVALNDIIFFESKNKDIIIQCKHEAYTMKGKLSEISKTLPDCFLQIHKSYIVNYKYVKRFATDKVELEGISLPVSEKNRKLVKEFLLNPFK